MADWEKTLGFSDLEQQYNLPKGLLSAVMKAESAGNPKAVSHAGAKGLFQFIDSTAKHYGVDQFDPQSSAIGAAKYYSNLLNMFDGDLDKALAGYNWGEGNVKKLGMDRAPAETRNYIQKIKSTMGVDGTTGSASSGFDPDAFLAKTAPKFDPDAFLAKTAPVEQTRKEPNLWQKVRPWIAPTVEALGAAGGAVVGAGAGTFGAGPVGTVAGGVAGAGLGYGGAKELLQLGDVYLGGEAPRQGMANVIEPVRNVLEGATFEAGGRVAAPIIGKAISKVSGAVADARKIPLNKAAKLARASVGDDLTQAVNALRNAPPGTSVAEATAGIQNPTWQALVKDSLEKAPSGAQYLAKFNAMTEEEGVNALARMAGGSNATEVRGSAELAKQTLNDIMSPARQAALARANKGQTVAALESQADELAGLAADKVAEVRRLIKAGNIAGASARLDLIKKNLPVGFTYKGELAKMADEWASKAADASLDLGQGARFATDAADTLRAAGVKPLKTDSLINRLGGILKDTEFAGNDIMESVVRNLRKDLTQWTSTGGVIDARALDAIRKNSVNAAVRDLMKGASPTEQRQAAASVMTKIKPMIVDAIEGAGGKGYRQYLEDYSSGMLEIAKQKLTGEALTLWKTDKDAFVRLVKNESPEAVEKILGPGKYNIATELADDVVGKLETLATKRLNQLAASKQATDGHKALVTVLRQNMSKFRLPSWLSFWGAAANKTLSEIEKAVGAKTMRVLGDSMTSTKGAADLLERVPAAERIRILKLLQNPEQWSTATKAAITGTTAGATNALAPDRYNENAMVP